MYPRLEYDRTQLQDNVVDFDTIIFLLIEKQTQLVHM